ncbi:MAG: hypothetical protein WAN87_05835 [Thermoplasmata archaeon]
MSDCPLGAVVPLAVAAISMTLEGIYLMAYRWSPNVLWLVPSSFLSPSPYVSGSIALTGGAILLALALVALAWRGWHRSVGVGALTLGLLSLFSGGGFFIGAFLAYFGGVIAIYHTPPPGRSSVAGPSPDSPDYDPVVEADLRGSES